jgi:hypothetical protein
MAKAAPKPAKGEKPVPTKGGKPFPPTKKGK